MKILVASAFYADSHLAHAINTLKMADGFAQLGHQVMVVCRRPLGGNLETKVLREDFGLSSSLQVVQVRSHLFGVELNEHAHFAFQVAGVARKSGVDFVYSRNYMAPVALSRMGVPVVAESHAHPGNSSPPLLKMVAGLRKLASFRALVTIAPVLKENFTRLGVPKEKVLILPDAVDLALFQRPASFKRMKPERPRIVYAGHFYDYKGIPTILDAAALMPECDFVLIGGNPNDIERHRKVIVGRGLENVEILGWMAHRMIGPHLWGADVLLLPPSAKHPSARWTSPVKLGEYLASGTPVVATRIPALEYWLNDDCVCFSQPDNGDDLAKAIRRTLDDSTYASALARNAMIFAQGLSYQTRCQKILKAAGF